MQPFPEPLQTSETPSLEPDFREVPPRKSGWSVLPWVGVATLFLIPGGVALWAIANLVGLPEVPQCWAVSRSDNAASAQIYCAEVLASKKGLNDLRRAILMVETIPTDHVLRAKGDRLIREWTEAILRQGEAEFQNGDLDKAIEVARNVPSDAPTHPLVQDRIRQWQSVWSKAEEIYAQTQAAIDEGDWYTSLSTARQLLLLNNRHWGTTKYQELMQSLQAAKDNKQNQRRVAAKNQNQPQSTSFDDLINQWDKQQAMEDTARLNRANQLAQSGKVEDLQAAVDEAEQILYGTAAYDVAQQQIGIWKRQLETIQDRPYLVRARELANRGDIDSLRAAIDEANQIAWGRALYEEARSSVEQWRLQMHDLQMRQQDEPLRTPTPEPNGHSPAVPLAVPPRANVREAVPAAVTIEGLEPEGDRLTPGASP